MESFSFLDHSFSEYKEQITGGLFPETHEFCIEEKTKEAREKRLNKIQDDYWLFDETYFPPEYYQDTYSKPNIMHHYIIDAAQAPGVHVIFGPRKHGKTPTGKKVLLWLMITGQVHIAGTYSEGLLISGNILRDLYILTWFNPRLKADFNPKFVQANTDQITVIFNGLKKERCYITAFSEDRSVRGYTRGFSRPEFLLGDDLETLQSSFTQKAVTLRLQKIAESYQSCTDNATFLIFGNDFSLRSGLHQLRSLGEMNLLPKHYHVTVFKAWYAKREKLTSPQIPAPIERKLDKTKLSKKAQRIIAVEEQKVVYINRGPLWKERYNVSNESELRSFLKPVSEADWQANFQANPVPEDGDFFKREFYCEYETLPPDLRCVVYCDPNLAKKSKGDTTAAVAFGYSAKLDRFYIAGAICKSFSDSNELLDRILKLRETVKCVGLAFDGNVSQESSWTQHVKNYSILQNIPFPHIEYKRYHVNDLAKNLQLIYNEGRLLFPRNFSDTKEGELFMNQFFAFRGEKESNADDAPDALICALEFIYERRIIRKSQQAPRPIKDYYF